jgi:hypothetical protein
MVTCEGIVKLDCLYTNGMVAVKDYEQFPCPHKDKCLRYFLKSDLWFNKAPFKKQSNTCNYFIAIPESIDNLPGRC